MVPEDGTVKYVFGVVAAQGIHILRVQLPFMQMIFGSEPVRCTQWITITARYYRFCWSWRNSNGS